jgi:hypothetical protein
MGILKDLSDVNDEGSTQIPRVGTPYQCQARDHFSRDDGSLNYRGYFSELLGLSFSSSDLDNNSGDVESNNSSGTSSDCVIISSSSFTGKRRDESLAIVPLLL